MLQKYYPSRNKMHTSKIKNNRLWFTFIELIIVVLIMSIIWVFSISSFWNFFNRYDNDKVLSKIRDNLDILDFLVRKWELSSYRIFFNSWASWYIIDKEFLNKKNIIKLDGFSYILWSWSISWWTWIWILKTYYDWKIKENYFNSWTDSIDISLKDSYYADNINIFSSIDNMDTNNLEIIPFWDNTLDLTKITYLSWWYDSFQIENILWKKQFLWQNINSSTWNIDNISIWFEKWSREFILDLIK